MDSEPKGERRPGTVPIPGYLRREEVDDPIPQLRHLIKRKLKTFVDLNNMGIQTLDGPIKGLINDVLDQGLQKEVIDDMKRFKEGRGLSREGLAYKNELESDERRQSPTLKLADLIVNKICGMDVLSNEELKELDRSIQTAHAEAQEADRETADSMMTRYFTAGKKLTPIAKAWLEGKKDVVNPGTTINRIIQDERESLRTAVKTT